MLFGLWLDEQGKDGAKESQALGVIGEMKSLQKLMKKYNSKTEKLYALQL